MADLLEKKISSEEGSISRVELQILASGNLGNSLLPKLLTSLVEDGTKTSAVPAGVSSH